MKEILSTEHLYQMPSILTILITEKNQSMENRTKNPYVYFFSDSRDLFSSWF